MREAGGHEEEEVEAFYWKLDWAKVWSEQRHLLSEKVVSKRSFGTTNRRQGCFIMRCSSLATTFAPQKYRLAPHSLHRGRGTRGIKKVLVGDPQASLRIPLFLLHLLLSLPLLLHQHILFLV